MKNYLLITNGRLLLFFLSFTFAINLNAQTYVIPHAELAYNTVTDHEGQYISYGTLEKIKNEVSSIPMQILLAVEINDEGTILQTYKFISK